MNKRWICLLFCLLVPLFAFAQGGSSVISGKVMDTQEQPIIGAGVLVKGSTNGTVTDADGRFSLQVPSEATIVFSAMGYEEREWPESALHGAEIVLEEETESLEATVVVGYGVQKKVNLTGSVSAVNMDQMLEGRAVTNISAGLSGLSAGLYVNQNTGRPNGDSAIMFFLPI